MRKLLSSILFVLISLQFYGQSIGRQVIGCTGKTADATSSITATVGPSILTTVEGEGTILTQGFQQPTTGMLTSSFTVINPDCYDITSGQIDLTILGCIGNYQILWSTGDTTEVVEDLLPGTYHYTITSGVCSLSDSVEVELVGDCGDFIPNLVTPNADGVNDNLEIPQFHLSSRQVNEVTIYNQWGQKVWNRSNYDNTEVSWNGLNDTGETLPSGTYFYLVTLTDIKHTGFIELLR